MSESSRKRATGDDVRWVTFRGEQVNRYTSDEELIAALGEESFENRKLAARVSKQVNAAVRRVRSARSR